VVFGKRTTAVLRKYLVFISGGHGPIEEKRADLNREINVLYIYISIVVQIIYLSSCERVYAKRAQPDSKQTEPSKPLFK